MMMIRELGTYLLRGIAVFSLLTLSAHSAHAYGQREFFMNSAAVDFLGGANRLSIAPGFNFGIFSWLQIGGSIGYQSLAFGNESINTTTYTIGPTFNLGGTGSYLVSDFIFAGYAVRRGSGHVIDPLNDPSGSGFSVFYGKRIPFLGTFAYRPSVGFQMAGRTTVVLNLLAASYFF